MDEEEGKGWGCGLGRGQAGEVVRTSCSRLTLTHLLSHVLPLNLTLVLDP